MHDTGSTQAHWPFPHKKVGQGYAYILTHPGMPCIFWDHFFEWGDTLRSEINSLLQVGLGWLRAVMCCAVLSQNCMPYAFECDLCQQHARQSVCSEFWLGVCAEF